MSISNFIESTMRWLLWHTASNLGDIEFLLLIRPPGIVVTFECHRLRIEQTANSEFGLICQIDETNVCVRVIVTTTCELCYRAATIVRRIGESCVCRRWKSHPYGRICSQRLCTCRTRLCNRQNEYENEESMLGLQIDFCILITIFGMHRTMSKFNVN